jgi:ribosomal protein S18 acetylase RimI-like enzyme
LSAAEPRAAGGALAPRVTVRAARLEDAPAIAGVHRESWRTTYAGILPLDVIAREAGRRTESAWRRRLAAPMPETAQFVAQAGDGVIGFASCGPARHRLQGLESEIYALYVLQPWQRQGAGRALVRECAAHFVRHGRFGFYLWVLKANRARLFYERMGGEEIGEKHERLGLHSFAELAYGWHDLSPLIAA